MSEPTPSRRGVALLLVLAALLMVTGTAVMLLRATSTEKLRQRLSDHAQVADDLMLAADAPIRRWLTEASGSVVLVPELTEPRVELLHDTWTADGLEHEVRISAWDQCGMAPFDVAGGGSLLRSVVPADVLRRIDTQPRSRDRHPGLDLFAFSRRAEADVTVFPEAPPTRPIRMATAAEFALAGWHEEDDSASWTSAGTIEPPAPSVGACIATHNPGCINVSTAPIDLVRVALRAAGRGGLDQIRDARTRGEAIVIGAADSVGRADRRRRGAAPRLVTSSTAWAFRVDTRVGAVRRSWWLVYAQPSPEPPRRSARSGPSPAAAPSTPLQWECLQRLVIPE